MSRSDTRRRAAGLLARARRAKHRVFLAYKPYRFRVAGAVEPLFRLSHRVRPVHFDPQDWPHHHVAHDEPIEQLTTEPLPRRIFVCWTGDNPMSANRVRGLASLRSTNPDVDVVLVTQDNLEQWVLADHPLHSAYRNLSLIHRSDYLRCYLLHFHGGGYADLKPTRNSWAALFARMDASDAWMGGYRVPVRLMTPNDPDPAMERAMRACSELRLGQCAYLARPRTPLTAQWWRELNRRMDTYAAALAQDPGDAFGDNPGYPVPFNALLAQVVDPLQVKYREHLVYDPDLMPVLEGYR